MTEFKNIKVSERTHERLAYISKITSIPMAKIIENITECLMGLAVNYDISKDYATFAVDYSILEGMVHIKLRGYPKIKVGVFQVPTSATDEECNKRILSESTKALEGDK